MEDVGLAYTTIGGLGSSLLGALFWFMLASVLEVENYGLVNYYIALAAVTAALGILGLNTTVTTYLAKGEENIVYEANSLALVSGLFSALTLSVFQWGSGLLSAALIFFNMALAETLGRKMYLEYAFLSIGQRIAQIALSLILYFQVGIPGIILGYFLGNLIFSYRYLKSVKKFTFKINDLKEKRDFTLHSYGFNLTSTFATYLDKIIIAPMFGYYVLGLYQLGFQFFMFLSIIPGSLYRYLLPEESSGENKREIKLIGLISSVALALTTFMVSPYVIEKLFPTFTDSIPIVKVMSLAVIPSTIAAILTASLLGRGKSRTVFTAGLVYIASLITGLTILERILGVLGLALALIIAQTTKAICLSIYNRSNE